MRNFALALASVLLSSCASTTVSGDYKFAPNTTNGLAIGSITYDGWLGLYQVIAAPDAADQKPVRFNVGQSQWTPFHSEHDKDLGMKGGTFAVEIPAGTYRIRSWSIFQGPGRVTSTAPIDIAFVVEAGKATYLGRFHFRQTASMGLGTRSAVVSLEDKSARDLPILQSRFSVVAAAPLAFQVRPGTQVELMGGEGAKSYSLPIIVPVSSK